jgi:hypothetical protein
MATAAAAVLAMALAGCGSDEPSSPFPGGDAPGDLNKQVEDFLDKMSEAAKQAGGGDIGGPDGAADGDSDGQSGDGDDGTDDGDSGDVGKVHHLVWHVPSKGATPEGFTQFPSACEAPDAENLDKHKWINYAVPETWNVVSKSSGSDSPLSDTTTISYYEGGGNSHKDYIIEFDTDRFEPDQESPNGWTLVDFEKKPWQTHDYEYQVGDDTYQIHFDTVATATVGEQEVQILKAPQEQAPEALSRTEYRARILFAEVPTGPANAAGQEPPWRPQSSVMSIKYDAESGRAPLTDDLVVDIVSSIAMPSCGIDYLVAVREGTMNFDIDGDGHVTTQQEMLEAMRAAAG